MPTANKVNFGLKNVHYAVITMTDGVPSWATPVKVPGAVSATMQKASNISSFYADDMLYFRTDGNNGYTGTLEMADFPVAMRQALWGDVLTSTGKLLIEDADAQPVEFALLFEIDGDKTPTRYCFPRCVASRPDVGSSTKTETTEPQTQSCDLTVMPVIDASTTSVIDGVVRYRTTADTPSATYSAFFNAVNTTLA